MDLRKPWLLILAVLIAAVVGRAQSSGPTVEIVLSSDQAQQGDTINADVVIRDGHAVAGADIGISVDTCLRVVGREPGNYLPSTSETGGFSPFAEQTDSGTRFAASIIDRARIANGDGTFYRAILEVTCATATPVVSVSYAQIAELADPASGSNDLRGYSLERGSLSVISAHLTVQPGAVVATPAPIAGGSPVAAAPEQTPILIAALAVMAFSVVGLVILLLVYQRQRRNRKRTRR